jgi:transmembrane sensor
MGLMNKQELEQLINKYLAGDCTNKEESYLIEFFETYKEGEEKWDTDVLGDIEIFKTNLYNRIKDSLKTREFQITNVKPSLFRRSFKIAATVIVILGIGLALYLIQDQVIKSNSVAPPITEWDLKNTDSGEKLTFRLPDGTVVKLNSSSKLNFPTKFREDKREVELEGEAFFDVAKDSQRPFVIRTNSITTSVLGTSFNINAYPESNLIAIAVVTGKVKVEKSVNKENNQAGNVIYLYPSRKATYVKGENQLIESDFISEQEIGWKQGIIYFKNASESDVMERLERWYGVDIQINNDSLREWDLTASFDNQMLDAVLLSLSHTANFNYSINNKKIIINYIKSE